MGSPSTDISSTYANNPDAVRIPESAVTHEPLPPPTQEQATIDLIRSVRHVVEFGRQGEPVTDESLMDLDKRLTDYDNVIALSYDGHPL